MSWNLVLKIVWEPWLESQSKAQKTRTQALFTRL